MILPHSYTCDEEMCQGCLIKYCVDSSSDKGAGSDVIYSVGDSGTIYVEGLQECQIPHYEKAHGRA